MRITRTSPSPGDSAKAASDGTKFLMMNHGMEPHLFRVMASIETSLKKRHYLFISIKKSIF